VIQPTKADPAAALLNLRAVFPVRAEAVTVAFQQINQKEKRFPGWRELQVKSLIKTVSLFAFDVEDRYRARRGDQLATAVRNLTELLIWIEYCAASEENARAFCNDGPRDLRELLEALQKVYSFTNSAPQPLIADMLAGLRSAAVNDSFPNIEKRYIDVRDAAKEIGKLEAFGPLFKAFSKFTHPTALAIHIGCSPAILDALFVNGTQGALGCFRELEKFIGGVFPEIIVRL